MELLVTLPPAYSKQCEKTVHEPDVTRLSSLCLASADRNSTDCRRRDLGRADHAPDARLLVTAVKPWLAMLPRGWSCAAGAFTCSGQTERNSPADREIFLLYFNFFPTITWRGHESRAPNLAGHRAPPFESAAPATDCSCRPAVAPLCRDGCICVPACPILKANSQDLSGVRTSQKERPNVLQLLGEGSFDEEDADSKKVRGSYVLHRL